MEENGSEDCVHEHKTPMTAQLFIRNGAESRFWATYQCPDCGKLVDDRRSGA